MADYWLQQTSAPLFPDIVWSRPENKMTAGKLLIIGGNAFGFSAPATAFSAATKAGIGSVRILMPSGLQKVVGHLPDAFFAPQNPSGSFSKRALDEMLLHSSWSDGVLLAGELGRNSETAVTLETFAKKYAGLLTVTKDAVDYFLHDPTLLTQRERTCVVLSMEQLQKLGIRAGRQTAITLSMNNSALAEWLHDFTTDYRLCVVTLHNKHFFVACGGTVASSPVTNDSKIWRVETAARASVFWLQTPTKPVEAIETSFLEKI
jgi:hypothetical protein